MTDTERTAQAIQKGKRMLGPIESEPCAKHPKEVERFRWVWPVGSSPEHADVECVESCEKCEEESLRDDD